MRRAVFCGWKIRSAAVLALLVLSLAAPPPRSHAAVEVIPLHYRNPTEVLPLVRAMLSPEGRISADERTNSLIIVDSEEAIGRIRQSLALIDARVPQATVRLRFEDAGRREDRSVSAGGRVSGDHGAVSAGRPPRGRDGVELRAQDRTTDRSGRSEYFITTLSGSWAYIRVGQDIPYSPRWAELCRRYGQPVVYQRIETGFDVKPLIREGMAMVEIVPRIAEAGTGGRAGVVRFAQAATQLDVPLGQWADIGGYEQGGSEVLRAILEAGSSRSSSSLGIRLMVESY